MTPDSSSIHLGDRRSLGRRLLTALLTTGLLVAASVATARTESALTVNQATATAGPSTAGTKASRDVGLPDAWMISRPGYEGIVRYRLSFERAAVPSADLLGIYVERACSVSRVSVNGGVVFAAERPARGCGRPLLVPLPAALLSGGANTMEVDVEGVSGQRVATVRGEGGLGAVEIGSHADLSARHRWLLRTRDAVVAGEALLLGMLGLALLVTGRVANRRPLLLQFGWLCVAIAALFGIGVADAWPNGKLELLRASAWAIPLALAVRLFLVRAGLKARTIDHTLALQCLVMPATLTLAGPERLAAGADAWYVLFGAELLLAMAVCLAVAVHRAARDAIEMGVIIVSGIALAALELIAQLGDAPAPAPSVVPWLLPLLLGAVAWRLLSDLAASTRRAHVARLRAATRLRSLIVEWEARGAAFVGRGAEQLRDAERKRIASDLHDDLGAKLLTIAHARDASRVPELAREALDEMRLVVRGLTGRPTQLADALADWRSEAMARFADIGIEATWDVHVEGEPPLLPARVFMQTTRIVREAINNVVKHSGATRCDVRCRVDAAGMRLTVSDDGRGLDGRASTGEGLRSMRSRAASLSGRIDIDNQAAGGVAVTLVIPLVAGEVAASATM